MKYLLDEDEMADLVKRKELVERDKALEEARKAILGSTKCRNTPSTVAGYGARWPGIHGGYCNDCPVFKVYGHGGIDIGCKLSKEWAK